MNLNYNQLEDYYNFFNCNMQRLITNSCYKYLKNSNNETSL